MSGAMAITTLTFILVADGIAYGLFLTAGQSHITELSSAEERGGAVGGLYNGWQYWRLGWADSHGINSR